MFPASPVLIVDDNEALLRSYEMVLKSNGINNLKLISDGREALKLVDNAEPISLVVLDLWMPQLHGENILKAIKMNMPKLKVIVITGCGDAPGYRENEYDNIAGYLHKPVDDSILVESIRGALSA